MESPAHSPAPARSLRGRPPWAATRPGAITLLALLATLLATGCGDPVGRASSTRSLVTGRRAAPLPSAQLAAATAAAERFARAYSPTVYLRRPPAIPGTTAGVKHQLRAAALRVPERRRGLHPRPGRLRLKIGDDRRVTAVLRIVDGRSPAFSIGFVLALTGAEWTVVSVSTPD